MCKLPKSLPDHIVFHKTAFVFIKIFIHDNDFNQYICRKYNIKVPLYFSLPGRELRKKYTSNVEQIHKILGRTRKESEDIKAFVKMVKEKVPEKTFRSYYQVVWQVHHIQTLEYKEERREYVLRPLQKAIRRKQKYMYRFLSNEEIMRLRKLMESDPTFYLIEKTCDAQLRIVEEAEETLNEILEKEGAL